MTPNRSLVFAFVISVFSIASVGALGQVQDAKSAADAQQEKELAEVGEETAERACSECHSVDEVTGTRRTPRDWNDMVDTMAARGVTATDKELATVKRYLARYFGIVRVNNATAEELSAVLGLTVRDAQAVVEHRKANGRFANSAALLKVVGIDKAKIEEQPQALRFD